MKPTEHTTLIEILAATDALWLPCRDIADQQRNIATTERRRVFEQFGVAWGTHRASDADRQSAHRSLQALVKAGMVRPSRPRALKTLFVKLTDAGDTLARQLTGLPTFSDIYPDLIDDLRDKSTLPTAGHFRGRVWVRETVLAGGMDPHYAGLGDADRIALSEMQDACLPALVRGVLVSGASVKRHVSYAIGELPETWPDKPSTAADYYPPHGELYDKVRRAAYADLGGSDAGGAGEIGEIPLPVSF